MEGLQLTYVLADLNGLRTVQKEQAEALLNAKLTPASPTTSALPAASVSPTADAPAAPAQQPQQPPQQPQQQGLQPPQQAQHHHARTGSASGLMSRNASPAIFDKANSRRLFTPPLSRNPSHQGSTPGTPRHTADSEEPSLVLQELRKRLQRQDMADLKKMRDAIAALHSKQQAQPGDATGPANAEAPDLKRKAFSYTGTPRSPSQ